jgi:hypothetical protein
LLIVKQQKTKYDQYKVYRKPIPLELLHVYTDEDSSVSTLRGGSAKPKAALTKRNSFTKPSASTPNLSPIPPPKPGDPKNGFPITFIHLGRQYYNITLYAPTWVGRKKWLEHITKQQNLMNERSTIFGTTTLSEGFFIGSNRVNCAAPFCKRLLVFCTNTLLLTRVLTAYGRKIVYGTNDGVYLADLTENAREPMKVLAVMEVVQVDVLEEYQLLVVLAGKYAKNNSNLVSHSQNFRKASDDLPFGFPKPS